MTKMSHQDEHEFYARPENQTPRDRLDAAGPASPRWSR